MPWIRAGPGGARLERGAAPGSSFLILFRQIDERCAGFVLAMLWLGGRRLFFGGGLFAGLADLPVAELWLASAAPLCFVWIAFAFPLGRFSPCWLSFPSSESPGLLSMFLPCLMLAFLVLIPEKEKSASGCSVKTTEQGTCRF